MNPIELSIWEQYTHSVWALWSSTFIIIGVMLYAYDRYAKRWSAITGLYQTDATVMFSKVCTDGHSRKQALVIYTYMVDGRHFKGQLVQPKANLKAFVEKYPVGTEIPLYYAQRDPAFSTPFVPPTNLALMKRIITRYFAFPVFALHIASLTAYVALS